MIAELLDKNRLPNPELTALCSKNKYEMELGVVIYLYSSQGPALTLSHELLTNLGTNNIYIDFDIYSLYGTS